MWSEFVEVFQNPDVIAVILLSLQVSATAVIIGMLLGIPLGAVIGLFSFPGRKLIIALIYTMMGFPPVLIGVVVYLLLSRQGILGGWELLFTPSAMVLAQIILVTPIITGLTLTAVYSKERFFAETAQSLGANRLQMVWALVKESRKGIWAAVATAFGRAISEVGAVMLVGGNIEGHTRVMTTAIILETRKGNFEVGLTLGIVLLLISFAINSFLLVGMLRGIQGSGRG
ncbi:ABC transporter permease [Ammoniphilus sp. 3BR4]|uniref:ABC transporter permease n=1 Tax=Ammoniphilus sp. 3BR4 TaxID=3158265 RepID=UPI003466A14E